MRLFNTMSRSVEEVKPLKTDSFSFYSCGPTVYDVPHIGNWYTFIRYDLFARVLKDAGLKVNWVMNITDVGHLTSDADEGEDKLEKGAKREGQTAWQIAERYTKYFLEGLDRLNIEKPGELPKATDNIKEQIDLVKTLEQQGHTYEIDDGIYFDTATIDDYGKLARLDTEHQREGARVEANKQKHNPTDFALWKFSPTDSKRDMEWDSPWGKGFPGWHLECSAMAIKFLGESIDLHAGGIDHIPIHHTNEIAQSEAATGKPFATYWLHSNFNLVDDKKMAKSAGNFITLEDIEKRSYDLMAFRLLVLQSHYRTEAHFTWDNLGAAANRLKNIQALADLRFQALIKGDEDTAEGVVMARTALLKALQDDFNTPEALVALEQGLDFIKNGIPEGSESAVDKLIDTADRLLGLKLGSSRDISSELKEVLKQRIDARKNKDWKKSDSLREDVEKEGIGVRDTDNGQLWFRL